MKIIDTHLSGVKIIEPRVHKDNRGFFMESFNAKKLEAHGLTADFVQDNHSLSVDKGIIRGLHYQLNPMAQGKLMRVITGAIFDVAVDIRENSPTFGEWVGVTLSATNNRILFIPEGFAHGFCTLMKQTHIQYKVDEYYSVAHEKGIMWDDPELAIKWPTSRPILSEKDTNQPSLQKAKRNFVYNHLRSVGDNNL